MKAAGVKPASYNAWEGKSAKEKKAAQAKGITAGDFKRGKTPEQERRQARTVAQRESKNEKRQAVIQHVSGLTGGRSNDKSVSKWIKGMSDGELDDLLDMDYDDLLDTAADSDDPKHRYKRLY